MHDVVAELHVLDDLGRRQAGRPEQPRGRVARSHQHDPRERRESPVKLDQAADVARVGLTEIVAHVVADLLKGIADLFDLPRGERGEGMAGRKWAVARSGGRATVVRRTVLSLARLHPFAAPL